MLRSRRRWLKCLIAPPAIVLGLFLLLQLFLATPWPRAWAAARIENRIGLGTTIGRLGWSPWDGIELHRLRIEKPAGLGIEPLLEVRRIRIWPDYSSLVSERREIRGMEVDGARLEMDVEFLLGLASRAIKEVKPPPVVAVAHPESSGGGVDHPPPAIPQPQQVPESPTEVPEIGSTSRGRNVWLTLNDCELVLSAKSTGLVRLHALGGAIPLSGLGEGGLSGRVEAGHRISIETDVGINLRRGHEGGLRLDLHSSEKQIQVTSYVVFRNDKDLSFQTIGSIIVNDRVGWVMTDGSLAEFNGLKARWQAMGLLRFPASWAARAEIQLAGVDLATSGFAGRVDEGSGEIRLHQGRLESPDFHLSASPISVRGNGWLAAGSGAVVARLLMPADLARNGSTRCGEIRWRDLTPGSMAYADLTLWSDEKKVWWAELGEDGDHVPWDQWMRCLRSGSELGR